MRYSRPLKNRRLAALAVALLLSALIAYPSTEIRAKQQADNHEHHAVKTEPRYSRSIASYEAPDVTLVASDGTKVRLLSALDYQGAVLLQFIFTTCPTICPSMSSIFSAAQDRFGSDLNRVRMISVSIDPEHDTPARLEEYARKFKAKSQWQFLTGSLDNIVAVQKAFGAYRANKMQHEPITYLRARPSEPWVKLNGLMSASQLLSEYHKLIAR